jgi:transcriptional regulator with XRE-family HTH domain
MPDRWFVSPEGLARARVDQLMTQEDLAKKSGLSVRSLRRYESREQPVKLEALQCLAKALSADVRDIARLRTKIASGAGSASASASASKSAPASAPAPLPRTALETLVDAERALGLHKTPPAPLATPRGPAEALTAHRLQSVFTAWAIHEGERFWLAGRIESQRGIAPAEAKLLGSKGGVAARFHVVKEIAAGLPLGVTVHSAEKQTTARLLALYGEEATLVLRVHLAPGADGGDDGPGFTSFITRITAKRPWTFVVEEVRGAAAKGEPPASPKAKGPNAPLRRRSSRSRSD